MTDKNDEYYQPWANDPNAGGRTPPPLGAAPHDPDIGLAKPQDLPPVGLDLSRYAEEDRLPREPLIDADKLKENTARLARRLRDGGSKFAAWTIAIGQKADIPARVEALELPRRSKELAKKTGSAASTAAQAAAATTKAAAQSTAKASKASAEKSAEVWQKMALGDKVSKIGSDAGRGLSEIADKTKTGIGQVAKAGKDSIGEKAGKLLPPKPEPEDLTPPPSGLDQLLEREAEAAKAKPAIVKSPQDLPLFSSEGKSGDPKADLPERMQSAQPQLHDAPALPEPHKQTADAAALLAAPDDAAPPPEPVAQKPAPMPAEAPAAPTTPILTPSPEAMEHTRIIPPVPSRPLPKAAPITQSPSLPEPAPAQVATTKADSPVPNYEVVNRAPAATSSERLSSSAAAVGGWKPTGRTLGLAGVALAALLGASFYLGSQFGGGLSQADVETIVADYITTNPQVIPAALEAQRAREIAKSIGSVRPALEKPYAGAWGGNANGDVTMVVFTDYACGFCRASVPDIDRLIREDKRVKIVYRELPIISRESRNAALMALMAARQGKYDAFHHAMFAQSSLSPTAIIAAAEKAGVSLDAANDTTADEAVFQRELESNLALATELQLNATPTWVIGDQLLQGQVGYAALQDAVSKARAKKAG